MWLEPYKNKYRAFERYTCPLTGKQKRVSTIIDRDTKAARKAAESVLRDKIAKASTAEKKVTLKELSKAYLAWQKNELKASSYASSEAHTRYIQDILDKDAIVSRLTARYVSEQLSAKSSTPYMTNRNILYFKAMINWGYDHDYVTEKTWIDKIKRVKAPKPISKIEDHYLESSELKTLINYIPLPHWKLLTEFLALSGLRIGEAMALKDSDVDMHIHVTKTYHSASKTLSATPKTESSVRDVFIQPELAEVVKQIRAYRRRIQMATGARNDIFFPNPDGGVLSYNAYQKRIRQYSKESIGRACMPHMLRHTHVSLLAEAGVPLETISRRLGHHDSAITREVYLHVTQKMRQQDNDLLSAIKIL